VDRAADLLSQRLGQVSIELVSFLRGNRQGYGEPERDPAICVGRGDLWRRQRPQPHPWRLVLLRAPREQEDAQGQGRQSAQALQVPHGPFSILRAGASTGSPRVAERSPPHFASFFNFFSGATEAFPPHSGTNASVPFPAATKICPRAFRLYLPVPLSFTPAARRMTMDGQKFVKADWIRLTPIRPVSQSHAGWW